MVASRRLGLVVGAVLFGVCERGEPEATSIAPAADGGVVWPSTDEVLTVELKIDPADWDAIRSEGRPINGIYSSCRDPKFAYRSVQAELSVGGRELGRVSVRKKGLYGSLSANKPSLRISLAQYQPRLQLFGSKTLVLNNSRQDPSFTHQCMAYAAFAAAGLPAPRCGFARVVVNGQQLGPYVLVESIKKPFLRRVFGEDSGALYEGGPGADFTPERLVNFEDENDPPNEAGEVLKQLSDALEAPASQEQAARVAELVDLPAFMRFWAVEALIAHWDGYSGDDNNFFVYVSARSRKLAFIPWGTDGAYEHDHRFLPEQGRPQSVYAIARLALRLYAHGPAREQYRDVLRRLLAEHWDEAALEAEIDRIAALIPEAAKDAVEAQRAFVRGRRAELESELSSDAPAWPYAERTPVACRENADSALSATFDLVWRDGSVIQPAPDNALDLQLDGERQSYMQTLGSAGLADPKDGGQPRLRLLVPQPDGWYIVLVMYIGARPIAPGEIRLHGFETYGIVVRAPDAKRFEMKGFVGDGAITFDEVGTSDGARWRGRIDAKLVSLTAEQSRLFSQL